MASKVRVVILHMAMHETGPVKNVLVEFLVLHFGFYSPSNRLLPTQNPDGPKNRATHLVSEAAQPLDPNPLR
jgi:hypothetical protein